MWVQVASVWIGLCAAAAANPASPDYPVSILVCPEWAGPSSANPDILAASLENWGYPVTRLELSALADPSRLNARSTSLLILPYGEKFPADARENFLAYLRDGGDFLSTGGYAFHRLLTRHEGTWIEARDLVFRRRTRLVDIGGSCDQALLGGDWHAPEGTQDSHDTRFRWTGAVGRVRIVPPTGTAWTLRVAGTVPSEASSLRRIVRFRGEAVGELTGTGAGIWEIPMPAIEARNPERIEIVFQCETFRPKDLLGTLDNRELGVAIRWIEVLAKDESPREVPDDLCMGPPPMNTAQGRANDFLEVEKHQVGVFDAGYPLRFVRTAVAAPGQTIVGADLRSIGPFEGHAATGMTGSEWYWTSPTDRGRLIPLIQGLDRHGRSRGNLGALILNFGAPYAESQWAFFGVTSEDLFSGKRPEMLEVFRRTVSFMARGLHLSRSQAEFACYRPGERFRLLTSVHNLQDVTRTVSVDIRIANEEGTVLSRTTVPRNLAARSVTSVTHEAVIPTNETDGNLLVRISLLKDQREVDREDVLLVVWRPETWPRTDFPLTFKNGRIGANGKGAFLVGTQAFYPQNSQADGAPQVVWNDFSRMADHGIHLARTFTFGETKTQKRFNDLVVAAAQNFGVLHFFEGLGRLSVNPENIARDAAYARETAERYRDVRGLIFDIRNEPTFGKLKNPDLLQTWARSIGSASPESIDSIPVTGAWDDPNVVRAHRFLTSAMTDWLVRVSAAVKEASPERLVSVGHLQFAPERYEDRRSTGMALDFLNQHFYAEISDIRRIDSDIAYLNRNGLGQSTSIGEFGSKTHPAFAVTRHNYDTEAERIRRYAHVTHTLFGFGGLFACNWHWRDPLSCIFPYGLFYPDGVPKPAAGYYRAMSLLFSGIEPAPATPEVYVLVPESHRYGGAWAPVSWAMFAAINRLLDCQVVPGTILESELAALPGGVRALVWPVPFCPSDETYSRVLDFVRSGGSLYLSGDLSYDAERRSRIRTLRLVELCGVEMLSERYPNIEGAWGERLKFFPTASAEGLRGLRGNPTLEVRRTSAESLLETADGSPVYVRNRVGKGQVFFNLDPVELRWSADRGPAEGETTLYRHFLKQAGIGSGPVEPATDELRFYSVPTGGGGEAMVLIDLSQKRKQFDATIRRGGRTLDIRLTENLPGALIFSPEDNLLAAETGGSLKRNGVNLLQAPSQVFAIALDGRDIESSHALAVASLGAGTVELRVTGPGVRALAELGEVRNGRWHPLASPSGLEIREGMVRYNVHPEESMDWVLISSEEALASAREEMVRRLVRPWEEK